MLTNGKYAVYHLKPTEDGIHKHLASVFALKNGGFHLLEDYSNLFTPYHTHDGDVPSNMMQHRIKNLVNNSAYYKVIPTKEDNVVDAENRHKVVTPQDINSGRQVFVFHSPHHNGPAQLVFDKGSFHLNGYPLSIAELKHIKDSVDEGHSHLTYPDDMFKAEEAPEIDTESVVEQPDNFFDQDYLVPEIGNMHAYRNYVAGEPPSGVHIYLTCKAVKDVLEDDGVKSHNDILIAIGSMLNDAAGVPDDSGKVFHVGHDSYYVHMPTYESGLQFLYNLQSLVNDLPTLYSKHPYFDIGMGDDMENAYAALSQLDGFKIPNKTEGNHVMIHTANSTRYISPEDIL
jgi:hypothetical protein